MRKLSLLIIVAAALWAFFAYAQDNSKQVKTETSPMPTSDTGQPKRSVEVEHNGSKYHIAWFDADPSQVTLVSNFTDQRTARDIKDSGECRAFVNGGFYGEDEKPLGLFETNGQRLSSAQKNDLFNGFVYKKEGEVIISSSIAQNNDFSVQTGPILYAGGTQRRLTVRNDKPARRMIAAVTNSGNVVFASFFDDESYFRGPYLNDMPELTRIFSEKAGFTIVDSINLDGGSASMFDNQETFLSSLTFAGSYFCVK